MSKKRIILILLGFLFAVIIIFVVAPFISKFFGRGESPEISVQGENFVFDVSIVPDPPKEKNNTLIINLKDFNGKPIEKADVEITCETSGMAGMPSIKKSAKAQKKGRGVYQAKLDLPSTEMWILNTSISTPQGTGGGRFTLSVGQKGLTKISAKTGKMTGENEIVVEEQRRQMIGVRTGSVIKGPMSLAVRAFGNISYDETELADATIRIRGWITDLKVNYRGEYVKKGQELFTLYSPELYAAQKEYLQILKRKSLEAVEGVNPTVKAARERLKLWGISSEQIDEITHNQEALEKMPFLSSVDGYVIEKNVVEGDIVEPGMKIFRIVPIEKVWLKAEIYQSDLLQIHPGDKAKITLPYIPGKTYTGHASYIYPYLQGNARTGEVLFQLENPIQELLPDMYANIELDIDLGERLQVPDSAVIYIGKGHLVFLDLGEGRLSPKKITVGLRSNGYYEVISGLEPGDRVVTSGNFLIAAESRILSAMKYWGEEDESKQGK